MTDTSQQMREPRFILKFTNPLGQPEELTIPCFIVPDLVLQGNNMHPGIRLARRPPVSGVEEVDEFIQEVLEYQINEGCGWLYPDKGTIETFEMAERDIAPIDWNYFPAEGEIGTPAELPWPVRN